MIEKDLVTKIQHSADDVHNHSQQETFAENKIENSRKNFLTMNVHGSLIDSKFTIHGRSNATPVNFLSIDLSSIDEEISCPFAKNLAMHFGRI